MVHASSCSSKNQPSYLCPKVLDVDAQCRWCLGESVHLVLRWSHRSFWESNPNASVRNAFLMHPSFLIFLRRLLTICSCWGASISKEVTHEKFKCNPRSSLMFRQGSVKFIVFHQLSNLCSYKYERRPISALIFASMICGKCSNRTNALLLIGKPLTVFHDAELVVEWWQKDVLWIYKRNGFYVVRSRR